MAKQLKLNSVSFQYDQQPILHRVSLQLEAGSIACLVGPSGCGKTSLMRLIAGFEQANEGDIHIGSQLVSSAGVFVTPENRNVGMVFQDLALFPHLNIEQNIAYGLFKLDKKTTDERVAELLRLCRLSHLQGRYPHQLSGGQRQRVALARALAPKPQLILMDEPFSGLDNQLHQELVKEIKDLLKQNDATVLWVTHDLAEALTVADQIGIILDGQLQQWAEPEALYEKPANLATVRFLNQAVIVGAEMVNEHRAKTALGALEVNNQNGLVAGDLAQVVIKHHDLSLSTDGEHNAAIADITYMGGQYAYVVQLHNGERLQVTAEERFETAQSIRVHVANKSFLGFAADE